MCAEINQAIRLLKFDHDKGEESLCRLREKFNKCVENLQPNSNSDCPPCLSHGPRFEKFCQDAEEAAKNAKCKSCDTCTTKALAWAILVDSALLNEQLFDDIQRVQKAKQVYFAPEHNPLFYGVNPGPEARLCFNEYVKARWPIHVFALDPEVQEQNVSDAYARRRETQLALAMAFANGEIGAKTFSRFARQTDFHLETISLNRTVIGFSHGNDTFGWRFYPRVQTPPTPGNFKAGWQNWVSGAPSRDDDLKCRQLEPGPRELLAIVVMPSFVPYVRVDSRSNWFKLTDPKRKEFTTQDSVRMGHMIQYIHNSKEVCLNENHMYRSGDVSRVMTAVNQLEKRLPLQDTLAQIPYENDLGGYRLFALGKRNLGPELIGYYGEPGVNLEGETNLFLVGRGFNVNSTKVIAGGQECEYSLLSREVMRVTIKKGAYTTPVVVKDGEGNGTEKPHVDIHVATPYGVSGHLFLPILSKPTASPTVAFSQDEVYGCIQYENCRAKSLTLATDDLKINAPQFKGKDVNAKICMTVVFADGSEKSLSAGTGISELPLNQGDANGSVKVPQIIEEFFTSTSNFSSLQQPIALKVTGAVYDTQAPTQAVAISKPLLIKVAMKQTPSACCPETQKLIWAIPKALMCTPSCQ